MTQQQVTKSTSLKSNNPDDSAWRSAWTKFTFLAFCWISYAILTIFGLLLIYLISPRLSSINHQLMIFSGLAIGIVVLVVGVGLTLITLTSLTGIDLLYPHGQPSITIKFLFPIAATLSQLLGVDRNRLRTSFVKVNNALTKAQRKRITGDRILVLLPHCLQIDICDRKITSTTDNCKQCGRCAVGDLVDIGKKYGLKIEVVNGGTFARRKVKNFRPTGIVAVACERDLTFGIQDVYPIPVFGVINDRPNGPCHNTCVDMTLVEEAIGFFRPVQHS